VSFLLTIPVSDPQECLLQYTVVTQFSERSCWHFVEICAYQKG